ncbi:hypothetical protein NKR23_g4090 [Pleurostoma richardsiae]|uniref:Fungal N-terminal domain-containing protein n=1 Tax=Pleurostoma richardsiae TaxID=41990 RepID=A0AA38VVS1_9PEZI|nr:hypothetical protein NKR23_g4090 [Pleurostoma richardsiae]
MDPISITGTAAGLVSLGLQVVDGMTTYLNAVKGRKGDLDAATQQVQNLQNLIKVIERNVQTLKVEHQEPTAAVEGCMRDCTKQLGSFRDLIVKLADVSPPPAASSAPPARLTITEAIKEMKKKAVYPFQRSKIEMLEKRLCNVVSALDSALAILNLSVSSRTGLEVTDVKTITKTLDTRVSGLDTKMDSKFASTETILQKQSQQADYFLPRLDQNLITAVGSFHAFQTEIGGVKTTLSTEISASHNKTCQEISVAKVGLSTEISAGSEKVVQEIVAFRDVFSEFERRQQAEAREAQERLYKMVEDRLGCAADDCDDNVVLGRMIAKPGGLRSLADDVGGRDALFLDQKRRRPRHTQGLPPAQKPAGGCSCWKTRRRNLHRRKWGSVVFRQEEYTEQYHFPACRYYDVRPSDKTRTFGIMYTGLAGLVSRAIGITFSIGRAAGGGGIGPQLRYCRMVDAKSSPVFALADVIKDFFIDRTKEPDAELHVQIFRSFFSRLQNAYQSRKACVTDYSEDGHSILQALTESPLQIISTHLSTFYPSDRSLPQLTEVLYAPGSDETCDTWDEATISKHLWGLYYVANLLSVLPLCEGLREVFCFGPMESAILRRDEEVLEILRKLSGRVWEPSYCTNVFRWTPLHLAAGWPAGLEALLASGGDAVVNQRDAWGETALDIAVKWTEETCPEGRTYNMCHDCDCFSSLRTRLVVLKHLGERVLQLQEEVQQLLPADSGFLRGLPAGQLADAQIPAMLDLLREEGASVPPLLIEQFEKWWPIYHEINDVRTADIAYHLGFRDVNGHNWEGKPPIATTHRPPYAAWLLDHGASLTEPILKPKDPRDLVAAHLVSYMTPVYDEFIKEVCKVLNSGASLQTSDGCSCKCTPEGCYPLTFFLSDFLEHKPSRLADPLALLERTKIDLTTSSWVAVHYIRFSTFEALEMVHTCCRQDPYPRSNDLYEQDDEEFDNKCDGLVDEKTFEALVGELEDAYRASSETFRGFMEGHWQQRIDVVLEEIDSRVLTEQEKRDAEEIGVVWKPVVPKTSTTSFFPHYPDRDLQYWMSMMDEIMPELGKWQTLGR